MQTAKLHCFVKTLALIWTGGMCLQRISGQLECGWCAPLTPLTQLVPSHVSQKKDENRLRYVCATAQRFSLNTSIPSESRC